MPELAEVEYYRKQWSPGLGQVVAKVRLHAEKRIFREVDTHTLKKQLEGQAFDRSQRHGKQMCFVFGSQHWLGVHIGMTGKTHTKEADYKAAKHDHLILEMQSGLKLVFTDQRLFGRIRYAKSQTPPGWWSGLPPENLSDAFTQEVMQSFLQRRAQSPVKAVLLMQEAFPGVGNWMADEILWRARIHPATRAGQLRPKQVSALYKYLREVCRDALEVIGADWGTPPNSWLFNHRWKDGGTCPRTGCALTREKIGGRTTCWSPEWQG